ncbi:MAG: GNAT family N-acetyltransferase [Acetobacteraceae bacterium]
MTLRLRPAAAADHAAIAALVADAFGRPDEAELVAALRANGAPIEIVAERDGVLLGHILFSRMRVGAAEALALAPLAVAAPARRQGIGAALVRAGLDAARRAGVGAVIVLGDPAYYGRFGFTEARGLDAPFSGPAFQALGLSPGELLPTGRVAFDPAFGL